MRIPSPPADEPEGGCDIGTSEAACVIRGEAVRVAAPDLDRVLRLPTGVINELGPA
jgi:hypothetical protein